MKKKYRNLFKANITDMHIQVWIKIGGTHQNLTKSCISNKPARTVLSCNSCYLNTCVCVVYDDVCIRDYNFKCNSYNNLFFVSLTGVKKDNAKSFMLKRNRIEHKLDTLFYEIVS
jgi:hypothetical protein